MYPTTNLYRDQHGRYSHMGLQITGAEAWATSINTPFVEANQKGGFVALENNNISAQNLFNAGGYFKDFPQTFKEKPTLTWAFYGRVTADPLPKERKGLTDFSWPNIVENCQYDLFDPGNYKGEVLTKFGNGNVRSKVVSLPGSTLPDPVTKIVASQISCQMHESISSHCTEIHKFGHTDKIHGWQCFALREKSGGKKVKFSEMQEVYVADMAWRYSGWVPGYFDTANQGMQIICEANGFVSAEMTASKSLINEVNRMKGNEPYIYPVSNGTIVGNRGYYNLKDPHQYEEYLVHSSKADALIEARKIAERADTGSPRHKRATLDLDETPHSADYTSNWSKPQKFKSTVFKDWMDEDSDDYDLPELIDVSKDDRSMMDYGTLGDEELPDLE